MNQVAIVFGLIIASVVAVGAFQVMAPLVTNAENRSMEAEVINLITAARDFVETRRRIGAAVAASAADMSALTNNGYLDSDLYSNGIGESVIGTDITVNLAMTAAGAVTGAGISYNAGDQQSCNWLRDRSQANTWPDRGPNAPALAACPANGVLTIPLR